MEKINHIVNLPREISAYIFEFDGTYKHNYSLCMKELNDIYLLHKSLSNAYIGWMDIQIEWYMYRNFSPQFHTYFFNILKK